MNYYRGLIKSKVLDTISEHKLLNYLKGSWLTDDYHYLCKKNITYSDIDLVIPGIANKAKNTLIQKVSKDLNHLFDCEIKVSIHEKASLSKLTFPDSYYLALAEYIAVYEKQIKNNDLRRDYYISKTILNLNRTKITDTYSSIVENSSDSFLKSCLDIKKGYFSYLNNDDISTYAKNNLNNKFIQNIIYNCFFKNPTLDYINHIKDAINDCKSIDRWLRQYLFKKMNVL